MAPAAPDYVYTSRTSIERLQSEAGVRLRLDDEGDAVVQSSEEDALDEIMCSATETVNFYLYARYRPQRLVNSWLVWRWCTVLAAYELERRRNNPASETLQQWAEEVEEKLKAIQDGRATLPGVPMRMTGAPKVRNWRIDQRYQWNIIRVEKGSSTATATPVRPDYGEAAANEG